MRYDDPYEGIDPLLPDRDKAGKLEPVWVTKLRLAAGAVTIAALAVGAVLVKDVTAGEQVAVVRLPFSTRDGAPCTAHKRDPSSCTAAAGQDSAPAR